MKTDPQKLALYGGALAVAALVIWAFALTGTPATQRKLADDREMAGKMECMACYAMQYACEHENRYPATQPDLVKHIEAKEYCHVEGLDCYSYGDSYYRLRSDTPDYWSIRYSLNEKKHVMLCGQFNFNEVEQKRLQEGNALPPELRDYQQGEQCITFAARKCNKS